MSFRGKVVEKYEKKLLFFLVEYQRFTHQMKKKYELVCKMLKTCHNGNHRQSRKTLTQKPKKIMSDIQKEISILKEILEDSILTPAERQTIWAEIAQLEA